MQRYLLIMLIFTLGILTALAQDAVCTELDFDEHISEGQSAYDDNVYDDAIFHFDCATQLNPDNAYAHRLLGDVYFNIDQQGNAIRAYGTYRDIAGDETEAYVIERLSESEFGFEEFALIVIGVSAFMLTTCAPVLFVVAILFSVLRKRPNLIVKSGDGATPSEVVNLSDSELLQHAEQFYYEVNLLKYREVEYPRFDNPDGWREFIQSKDFLGLWIALKSTPADILQDEGIDIQKHRLMMNRLNLAMKSSE